MAFTRSGVRSPSPPSPFGRVRTRSMGRCAAAGRALNSSPLRGNSSVGRAQPCQGWGREFESRFPLQRSMSLSVSLRYRLPKDFGWVAEWLCSGLQSRGRRFDSDPSLSHCPGGGIGRRKGLKIPREVTPVPVRLRPRAPPYTNSSLGYIFT